MTPAVRAGRLNNLLEWSAARPDYAAGLRAATATVVPLVIGEATGRPQLLWVALGGWLTTFADPGGPYPLRAATLFAYALAGAASTVAGTLCAAHPWIGVVALFFWAAGCALLRVYGEAAGGVGTLSLIAYCIALGTPASDLRSLALRGVLFVAGALWAAALALMLWPVHPYRPVRRAVADCHRALAVQARRLAAGGPGWFEEAGRHRGQIRILLEAARSVLGSVRRGRRGESRRSEFLVALYEAAELALGDLSALSETLLSLEERGEPRPASFASSMRSLALALESTAQAAGEEEAAIATPVVRLEGEGELATPLASLLAHVQFALEAAAALHTGAPGLKPQLEFGVAARRSIRDVLSPRSIELRHAIRVGATAAAAALLGLLLHRTRRYWIIVTTVIVIQPHSGATLRRGLQRVAGTVAGAMLAALLAPLTHGQLQAGLVLFALALAAAALRRHNYALYATLMTPLFLLMAESASGDWHLAGTRITSTLLGGLVALVGSFALWPHRERGRLPAALAKVLRTTRQLLDSAQQGSLSHDARREVGLALANADAAFERFLDEAHTDVEAEAMMAVRSQSRRLVGAIVALSAGGKLPPEAARQVGIALDALASAAEDRRPPKALPSLPAAPQGARLLGPVEVIHAALTRLAA